MGESQRAESVVETGRSRRRSLAGSCVKRVTGCWVRLHRSSGRAIVHAPIGGCVCKLAGCSEDLPGWRREHRNDVRASRDLQGRQPRAMWRCRTWRRGMEPRWRAELPEASSTGPPAKLTSSQVRPDGAAWRGDWQGSGDGTTLEGCASEYDDQAHQGRPEGDPRILGADPDSYTTTESSSGSRTAGYDSPDVARGSEDTTATAPTWACGRSGV